MSFPFAERCAQGPDRVRAIVRMGHFAATLLLPVAPVLVPEG